MEEDWVNELEKELQGIKSTPSTTKKAASKDDNFLVVFLLGLLCFLGYIVWENKKVVIPTKPLIPVERINIEPKEQPQESTSELNSRIEALENSTKVSRERIAKLGSIVNNNFKSSQKFNNDPDLIYFNKDWTIDKLPKYLDLTPAEREEINKWLKN